MSEPIEFSPSHPTVKLCLQAINLEEKGDTEEAGKIFLQAWNEATSDFERFIAAYHVARIQARAADRLRWFETALQLAIKIDNDAVRAAFPVLYAGIAKCHEDLNDFDNAKRNLDLANSFDAEPTDKGPFYHGTKADLERGDLLTAGFGSNYKADLTMNHIYFTALMNGAGLAASLAKGEGRERVYIVEPTGNFENDPNVTNKKFPGNPTRSYRTKEPLRIIGEATEWMRQTSDDVQKWRERLQNNKGEIIN